MEQTVKEMVLEREKQKRYEDDMYFQEQEKLRKKEISKNFTKEIKMIIEEFEYKFFNNKSSKNNVVKKIMDMKEYKSECVLFGQDVDFYAVTFDAASRLQDYKLPHRSPKYRKWKKELEEKFGIEISIFADYKYQKRYSNSGYEVMSDEIYQGIKVSINFPE